jgi:hypothetical protein
MSLFWLKNVPWATILANAPGVVDGAKKLAAAMRTKPAASDACTADVEPDDAQARLLSIEQQQRTAAELLRAMADQNAQVAQAVAALQQRARINLRIAVVALIAAVAALIWNFLR